MTTRTKGAKGTTGGAKGTTGTKGATGTKRATSTTQTPARPNSRRSSSDRLSTYHDKRDFAATPEPKGSVAPSPNGDRFVVQRHRASSLHYDVRLEAAGVLLSWAVPKGPTLDPGVKRLAMHVEDHPLDYYDFEGVIPRGEYGGGDVIVWDWGTWRLVRGSDPIAELAAGELHFELTGEKLAGRFALVRRGPSTGREQWLLIHKKDDAAVVGWDPEDHARSVKSGRTNDEVRDAPSATWSSSSSWSPASPDELAALDALRSGGDWQISGRTLRLTNLGKVLFPKDRHHGALTKRDLIRHYVSVAPAILPYLVDRPINLHRFPDGVGTAGFWHKARPTHAPDWLAEWHNPDAGKGETRVYSVIDSPAALAWAANFGAIELHPWTSTVRDVRSPTWAMIDIDPGETSSFEDVLVLARLHRTALEHLGVRAMPKVTGKRGIQIWVPVADGCTFDETRAWVERLSRVIAQTVPDMVSWEWEVARRQGRIRLDFTQNAINKTLVAPFSVRPVPGGAVSVPIAWDELDDPDLRPDTWEIGNVASRLRDVGDPLAPLIGLQQRLPEM